MYKLPPNFENEIVFKLESQKCSKHNRSPKITFVSNEEILYKCCCSNFKKQLQIISEQIIAEIMTKEYLTSLKENNNR